jgi:hypothetical protein
VATEITLKQAAQKTDELNEKWRKAAVRGLQSAAARGVQDIVTRIIPARTPQPVDRGIYRAGWRFYPAPDGAVIECFEPHAIFIEDGVRAENGDRQRGRGGRGCVGHREGDEEARHLRPAGDGDLA